VKVVWSALAELRAMEAVDHIAQDRPDGASEWLEALIARVAKLDRMARRGRVVPEIGKLEVREVFHAPYRVIYRVDHASVVILTVRHWRRSWDRGEVGDIA
jgi:plasmid stabilization system protein ParE